MNAPVALGTILRGVLDGKVAARSGLKDLKIWEVWNKAVGQKIAQHAQPDSFNNGRLLVNTSHPTWVTELGFRKEEIRLRLNELIGAAMVSDIVFRLGKKK